MSVYGKIRSALQEHHLAPKKKFGQNFLVDDGVIHAIVGAIGPAPNDNVVEIGSFAIPTAGTKAAGPVILAIRPEDISISMVPISGALECNVYSVLPAGADTTVVVKSQKLEITIKEPGTSKVAMDDKVWLRFDPNMINLYTKETGSLIAS